MAAFTNTSRGGYVLVGVDNKGSAEHSEADIDPTQFDEANLRQIVQGYLSGRFSIMVQTHQAGGERPVAVIYIAPGPDRLPVVFTKDGPVEQTNPQGRVKFRKGQVYVRRGTQCIAAEHADWSEILLRHDEEVREHARGPMNDVMRRFFAAAGGVVPDMPLAVDFGMDLDVFTDAVEAVRTSQHADLRRLARREVRDVVWESKTPYALDGVDPLIDRLLVIGAHAIRDEVRSSSTA